MTIQIEAMTTAEARAYRAGRTDAYGMEVERTTASGTGNPCRHCLQDIPEGRDMLILAYRPFEGLHPYAETGPIYLCADDCTRHEPGPDLPPIIANTADFLIKGYSADERIVYGTGAITPTPEIAARCAQIFVDPEVTQIHIRSARNNCYQARVLRPE